MFTSQGDKENTENNSEDLVSRTSPERMQYLRSKETEAFQKGG